MNLTPVGGPTGQGKPTSHQSYRHMPFVQGQAGGCNIAVGKVGKWFSNLHLSPASHVQLAPCAATALALLYWSGLHRSTRLVPE